MESELLDTALNAVAGVDVAGLSDAALHDRVLGLLRARVRVDALVYDTLDVWDARSIWSDDGSKSPSARLVAETGMAAADAKIAIRRARALRRLPAAAEATRQGRLQPGCVETLAEAMDHVDPVHRAADERILVDACADVGVDEARRVLRSWSRAHDPDGDDERARRRHESRHLTAAETVDGLVHLQGLLPAVGGHEWLNELNRLEQELYRHDLADGQLRTVWQRRADALVEMGRRSATLVDGHPGRRPRIGLTVIVGVNTAEQLCETLAGTPLPTGEIVPELDRADIARIIFDGPDTPLSVSPARNFTGALRTAIQVRDRRCTHPAICDDPAEWCDTDHIIESAAGGATSVDNGRLHCRRHIRNHTLRNRQPHRWRIRRPPRGWIPDTHTKRPRDHPRTDDTDHPDAP